MVIGGHPRDRGGRPEPGLVGPRRGDLASAEPKEVMVMEDVVAVLTLAVEMFALGLTVGLALARS
jgi:hypothetical protein